MAWINSTNVLFVLLAMHILGVWTQTCIRDRGGGCELYCHQTGGNTRNCSCGSLGEIKQDGTSCYYKPRLMFGQHASLAFLKDTLVFGVHKKTYTIQWGSHFDGDIVSLAHNYDKMVIFYTTTTQKVNNVRNTTVGFLNVRDRTHVKIMQSNNAVVYGLAYDYVDNQLYGTLSTGKIMRISDYNSPIAIGINVFATMKKPKGIQIDSVARLMFVTDIGSNAIVQFNLSTRSRNVVVNTTGYIPECIAIDMVGEKLFWIARHPGKRDKIEMANYDGSSRTLLKAVKSKHPFSITFWNGFLFWSDLMDKKIYETDVSNGDTVDSNIVLTYQAFSVQYFGHSENFTGEWGEWETVGNEKRRTCKRPALKYYNDSSLSPQTGEKFNCTGKDRKKLDPEKESSSSSINITYTAVPIAAFFVIVVLIAVVCFIYKRKPMVIKRRNLDDGDGDAFYLHGHRSFNSSINRGGIENPSIPDPIYETIPDAEHATLPPAKQVVEIPSKQKTSSVGATPGSRKENYYTPGYFPTSYSASKSEVPVIVDLPPEKNDSKYGFNNLAYIPK